MIGEIFRLVEPLPFAVVFGAGFALGLLVKRLTGALRFGAGFFVMVFRGVLFAMCGL